MPQSLINALKPSINAPRPPINALNLPIMHHFSDIRQPEVRQRGRGRQPDGIVGGGGGVLRQDDRVPAGADGA